MFDKPRRILFCFESHLVHYSARKLHLEFSFIHKVTFIMGGLISVFVCAIASLVGLQGSLCPSNETCSAGSRSARLVLSSTDNSATFQTFLYCTDNDKVDFDTFSNTPEGNTIATPVTLLSATSGGCTVKDDLTVSCGVNSTATAVDVTVCCRQSDSGLNAIVSSEKGSGSTVNPTLSVTSSDDTDEIYFVEIVNLDLTTTAPDGCNVGTNNYACTLDGAVDFNQAYVEF